MGIIKSFKKFADQFSEHIDHSLPAHIDDDFAHKVDWKPNKSGGASFKTHVYREDSRRAIFKTGLVFKLFCFLFLGFGLGTMLGVAPYVFFSKGEVFAGLFWMLWGLIFSSVGFFMFQSSPSYCFDKQEDKFYRNGKAPNLRKEQRAIHYERDERHRMLDDDHEQEMPSSLSMYLRYKKSGPLEDIYALQLIAERVVSRSKNGTSVYYSYELNLVFKDATRLTIVDHGRKSALEVDAQKLASFLNVPLWSAL